jgi:hypothetical protein
MSCRTALLAAALMTTLGTHGAALADDTLSSDTLVGGVHGGVSASSWIGETKDTTHLGAVLGGFARYRLAPQLSVQAELAMHDKGADFESEGGTAINEALLYLELPLLGRFDLPLTRKLNLHAVAGFAPALLMDSKLTRREELRPYDLQAHGGLGTDIQVTGERAVSAELRASFGLLDATDDARKARALAVSLLAGVTL